MTKEYKPALAIYFEELEARYGEDFAFDQLSDEELDRLEQVGREAIEQDERVTPQEKKALAPLMQLIDVQRAKRGRNRTH